jgi:hypothetical protein
MALVRRADKAAELCSTALPATQAKPALNFHWMQYIAFLRSKALLNRNREW